MSNRNHVSEEHLEAFVDGQLDVPDKARVLLALERSQALREQVAELRHLKDLVRLVVVLTTISVVVSVPTSGPISRCWSSPRSRVGLRPAGPTELGEEPPARRRHGSRSPHTAGPRGSSSRPGSPGFFP